MRLIAGVLFLLPAAAVLLIVLEVELTEYLTKEPSFSDSNACIHTTWTSLHTLHVGGITSPHVHYIHGMFIHIHDFECLFFYLLCLCFSLLHIREHN